VLGPERGIALIEKHPGLAARFTVGRETPFRIVESQGWPGQTCHIAPAH